MTGGTGYHSFETTVDKTNRVLNEIEHAYGWPKTRRNQSYAALRDEFEQRVRAEFPFDVEGGVEPLISTVLRALQQYGTEGEWADVRSTMPKDLAAVVP